MTLPTLDSIMHEPSPLEDGMPTLRAREQRLHLWNHHTGRSVCGRQVDRSGPGVTTDVSSVTCNVCRTEIGRLTSYIEEMADGLGGRVFHGILEEAGVFDRPGGL